MLLIYSNRNMDGEIEVCEICGQEECECEEKEAEEEMA